MISFWLSSLSGLVIAFAATSSPAAETGFPPGKSVSIYAGTAPGGTVDSTMRLVGRHIGRFLPGNPPVVARNMPGAGSRRLAAYLFNQAPKDGTEFGLLLRPLATDTLLTGSRDQFDVRKFTWLGSPSPVTDVCGFWTNSAARTLEQLRDVEIVIPGIGADAGEVAQSSMLRNLAGARIKTVIGYPSGGEMNLALERGEVHGRCALSWEAVKSSYPDWISERKFIPFVQFSETRHVELPHTPTILELAKTQADKEALSILLAPQTFGFPFAAPPGLAPETARVLREAFRRVLDDKEFGEEARKRRFDVAYVSGERLSKLLDAVYSLPESSVKRAIALTQGPTTKR